MTLGYRIEGELVEGDRVAILPHGWLRDEEAKNRADAVGFAAVDIMKPRTADPHVRGWGTTKEMALEAAVRGGFAAKDLEVYVCSKDLYERLGFLEVPCWLRSGIAYSCEEVSPFESVVEWIGFAVVANRRPEMSEAEWPAMNHLIQRAVVAYLEGHPAVGVNNQGIFGWTTKARKRGAFPTGEAVAPISPDVAIAAAEVIDNLKDKEIEQAFKRVMKTHRKAAGRAH